MIVFLFPLAIFASHVKCLVIYFFPIKRNYSIDFSNAKLASWSAHMIKWHLWTKCKMRMNCLFVLILAWNDQSVSLCFRVGKDARTQLWYQTPKWVPLTLFIPHNLSVSHFISLLFTFCNLFYPLSLFIIFPLRVFILLCSDLLWTFHISFLF